jgi:hypothetical protein
MVYLIKSAGYDKNDNFIDILKIGYTKDINCKSRVMNYIYHNPTCKLLFTIPLATEVDEDNLQYYFRDYLLISDVYSSNEWFYYNESILEYFKTHTTKESLVDLPNSPSNNRVYTTNFKNEVKNIIKYVINIRFLEGEISLDDSFQQVDNMVSHVINTLHLRSIPKVWEYVSNTFGIFPAEFDSIKDINLKKEVSNFIARFNEPSIYNKKMEILCKSNLSEKARSIVLRQIPLEFTTYYNILGPIKIKSLNYQKSKLEDEYNKLIYNQENKDFVINYLITKYIPGNKYLLSDIKLDLTNLFNRLNIKESPKASYLENFFIVKKVLVSNKETGKRDSAYEIIKIKDI